MRFRYIGEAPDGSIEQYGVRFKPGQTSEVTDEMACRKLQANRFFVVEEGLPEAPPAIVSAEQPKRRGRPPKVRPDPSSETEMP